MHPSSLHYMTPNLSILLERLALYRVDKEQKKMAWPPHMWLERFSKNVLSYFNKQSIPTLTQLLDVPVSSTLRPIPVQGPC